MRKWWSDIIIYTQTTTFLRLSFMLLDFSLLKLSAGWMFLPVEGLFSSGLALASLWWNRAVWVLTICGPVVVERWLLGVALRKGRAEQRRSKVHLKVVGHLDRTNIGDCREKLWPCNYKHPLTERNTDFGFKHTSTWFKLFRKKDTHKNNIRNK